MHRLGGTLDLLICESDLDILDFNISDTAVSDNHLLSCFINLSKVAPTVITRTSRYWRDFDIATFRSEVVATLGVHNFSSWNDALADELVEHTKKRLHRFLTNLHLIDLSHFVMSKSSVERVVR